MKEAYLMGGNETVQESAILTLAIAEGKVDPAQRVALGEISQDTLSELEDRVARREFIAHTDPSSIPCFCMDCRGLAGGGVVMGPKAAGGTTSLVVADALTTGSYLHPGEKAPAHQKRMLGELSKSHRVGGHCDNLPKAEDSSGCGAWDKLDSRDPAKPTILGYLERRYAEIFEIIESTGLAVPQQLADTIKENNLKRRQEGYATNGAELSEACVEAAGEQSVVTLDGPQKGVLVAILTVPGEILDQAGILKEYGPDYQVFEIEAWAIANGAKATSISPEEAHAKTVAGLAYNIAAGGVIAGPSMRVIVL